MITSSNNEKIKSIKKLYEKKYREIENKYIIEGIKIIEEAIIAKQSFDCILLCEDIFTRNSISKDVLDRFIVDNEDKVIRISENVLNNLSDTQTPQGIIAVMNIFKKYDVISDNVIFLDRLQDVGNIGTILRSATAFGFNTIILNKGCADIYNPKLIRATMGNIFKLNILNLNDNGVNKLSELKNSGYVVYSAMLENSKKIYEMKYSDKKVLIVGNEANGISDELINMTDERITIPMMQNTESLNVATATSIIMYEMRKNNE